MKKSNKKQTLAETQLEKALGSQNYHLESAEKSRESIERSLQFAREYEEEVVYWRRIVELERAYAEKFGTEN